MYLIIQYLTLTITFIVYLTISFIVYLNISFSVLNYYTYRVFNYYFNRVISYFFNSVCDYFSNCILDCCYLCSIFDICVRLIYNLGYQRTVLMRRVLQVLDRLFLNLAFLVGCWVILFMKGWPEEQWTSCGHFAVMLPVY